MLGEQTVCEAVALARVGRSADVAVAAEVVGSAGSLLSFLCSQPETPKNGGNGGALRLLEQVPAGADALDLGLDIEANQLCTDDRADWRGQGMV